MTLSILQIQPCTFFILIPIKEKYNIEPSRPGGGSGRSLKIEEAQPLALGCQHLVSVGRLFIRE
jgi:hypothetical protein